MIVIVSVQGAQSIGHRHELAARVQAAVLPGFLVGAELCGRVADPAGGNARITEAGQALLGIRRGGRVNGLDQKRSRIGADEVLHEGLRRFFNESGGLAVLVADNLAALGSFEIIAENTCAFERFRVGDGSVAGHLADEHGAAVRNPVEHLNVRVLTVVVILRKAGGGHPFAGSLFLCGGFEC